MTQIIDAYFRQFTDKLAYIEVKDTADLAIGEVSLKGLSLPVIVDEFVQDMKTGANENQLEFQNIARGIAMNLAIDKDFLYMETYLALLKAVVSDPQGYCLDQGLKALKEGSDNAIFFFRANTLLENPTSYAIANYARLLWQMAFEKNDDEGEMLLKEAVSQLEKVIGKDPDFPLSYYELGNINANLEHYIKATSFYRLALDRLEDPNAQEEVRERINTIHLDAQLEIAYDALQRMDYKTAERRFKEVLRESKRREAYRGLGTLYLQTDQLELAIEAFEHALEYGDETSEVHNDLMNAYHMSGDDQSAIAIATRGLTLHPGDVALLYNRAQLYGISGNLKAMIADFEELRSYDDLSDEIIEGIEQTLEFYK